MSIQIDKLPKPPERSQDILGRARRPIADKETYGVPLDTIKRDAKDSVLQFAQIARFVEFNGKTYKTDTMMINSVMICAIAARDAVENGNGDSATWRIFLTNGIEVFTSKELLQFLDTIVKQHQSDTWHCKNTLDKIDRAESVREVMSIKERYLYPDLFNGLKEV